MSTAYPKLSFIYRDDRYHRYHSLQFNDTMEDFVVKQSSDNQALYTYESLRLAFSRVQSDSLLCIVTLYMDGQLSVKIMHEQKIFMAESIILCQEDPDADQ